MSSLLSSKEQLQELERVLTGFLRLPIAGDQIPGSLLEHALAGIRQGQVLKTYDFADVIRAQDRLGWQCKSTKEGTPVTWKRAKLPDSDRLIRESAKSQEALQHLGNLIIDLCNEHARESSRQYGLDKIGYCRLVLLNSGGLLYFERELLASPTSNIFDPDQFYWRWSKPKATKKKQQLPALHGIHRPTGQKWWAWHGRGENQLHFSGEKYWWPSESGNSLRFKMPKDKLTNKQLQTLLSRAASV